jgi:hypothetical protein
MLGLDDPHWSALMHAYGAAVDTPRLLAQLETFPASKGQDEPWFSIWSSLAHQGDVYPASFAAVPHVIDVLSRAAGPVDSAYFHFPAWIEICRQRKQLSIPKELADAYFSALRRLPLLIANAADYEWDGDMAACALAALAAAKGYTVIAEAALELNDPTKATDVLEWLSAR